MKGTRRWPPQATPVVEVAVALFADLHREGDRKTDVQTRRPA